MDGSTLVLVLGLAALAALLVVRSRRGAASEGGEYKPIVIDRTDARISATKVPLPGTRARTPTGTPLRAGEPSTVRTRTPTGAPPSAGESGTVRARTPTGAPVPARESGTVRTRTPTGAPLRAREPSDAPPRTTLPSDPSIQNPARAHTSSSGPIDVASRLGATSEVAIRPPLPEAEHVPPDEIAVARESGLTRIRKRTSSTAPPTDATMPSVAAALATPEPVTLRGRVSYALTTAAFSSAGITANREDGFAKLVTWREIVGIVARRLPQAAPYDGAAFIDVVSSTGATLRILPWTEITGHTLAGEPIDRLRSLLQLLATQARDAQLDAPTKAFARGGARPAQLPDEKTLAAHDAKLR